MGDEAKQVLSKMEQLVYKDKRDQKQKYMRVKEATKIYPMSRTKLMEEAFKCGALYEVGKLKLINTEIFEEYLESCRIPGGIYR